MTQAPRIPGLPDFERWLASASWCGAAGLSIVDQEGRVVAANERLCRILNYTEHELVGMHFRDFTLAKDQESDQAEFAALVRGDKSYYHMDKTLIGKLASPVSGHMFAMRFEAAGQVWVIRQTIEGLSPEQVGAFAVMVRSLMEDWLETRGLQMIARPPSPREAKRANEAGDGLEAALRPWHRNPTAWAAIGAAGAAWPAIGWTIGLLRRIVDVLYPAGGGAGGTLP